MRTALYLSAFLTACTGMPAMADCVDDAAQYHAVNPWILRAIASVESGFRGDAVHANRNGTLDVGITQTNQVHFTSLARYGVQPADLLDACTSYYVAAWLLHQKTERYGNTWKAVGAYHSETPAQRDAYAAKVKSVVAQWDKQGLIP